MCTKQPLIAALLLLLIEFALHCSSSHHMAQQKMMGPMGGEGEHMRALASHQMLRAEAKKNETNDAKKEAQQPGAKPEDGEEEEDKGKPKKCVENNDCFSDAQCGKRSKCQLVGLERKKKAGTCDCGVCGSTFPSLLSCGLNSGPFSLDKNIVPRECGGLKGACVESPLLLVAKSKKCDCEAGFKAAGFKNMRDGQRKVCNKQKCDGKKDTCFGMKCTAGKCRCHLTDL